MIKFQYGAMSSKYELEAPNKFVGYATMLSHYSQSPHLVLIYSPEEYKQDNWASFDGKIAERLDEIFGGKDSFDKFFEDNIDAIKTCYETIKQVV